MRRRGFDSGAAVTQKTAPAVKRSEDFRASFSQLSGRQKVRAHRGVRTVLTNSPPNYADLIRLGKESIPNVARRRRKTNAAWLAPNRSIDFVLVANRQTSGRLLSNEDRVAHLPARSAVSGFDLFPELEPP